MLSACSTTSSSAGVPIKSSRLGFNDEWRYERRRQDRAQECHEQTIDDRASPADRQTTSAALVRPDHVHRRAYADPEVFELEQERIFGRLWIYVAHESQLKKPGDFVRTRLAAIRSAGDAPPRRKDLRAAQSLPASRRAALHGRAGYQPRRSAAPITPGCSGRTARSRRCRIRKAIRRTSTSPTRKTTCSGSATSQSYRGFVFANLSDNPSPLARPSRPDDRGDRQSRRSRARRRGRDRGFELHARISRQLEASSGERRRHLSSDASCTPRP